MIYHLKSYLSAFPEFVCHREFKTWKEVVEEFGIDLALVNYGENGERCPGKAEGLEFDSLVDGNNGQKFELGVQEFYVTDDDGKSMLKAFEIKVDYVTSRTATFHIDAETQMRAEELVLEACGNHDFTQHTTNDPEIEIVGVKVIGPSNEYFNPILVPEKSSNERRHH